MPNPTVKAHPLKSREPAPRVSETGDARRQALDWIAGQLRWERTLDALRAGAPDGQCAGDQRHGPEEPGA